MKKTSTDGVRPPMPIAIVGAGSIGTAFAVVHASSGRDVLLYDVSAAQRNNVLAQIAAIATDLETFDLLDNDVDSLVASVRVAATLEDAVSTAGFVHECSPEDLTLKRRLFPVIAAAAPADAIIATASSAITASEIAGEMPGRERCLVAHPGNPPFLLKTVEIVPAPFTSSEAVDATRVLLEAAGMTPIVVRKELKGFVFNRLQGAVLREAYCLVRDGVATVEEIDGLVRDGLGLRWSVVGPFEAVDLNTRGGIGCHAKLLGPAYEAMGAERGQHDPWTADLVEKVAAERRELLPLERWAERVAWRNRRIMAVLALRAASEQNDR